MNEDTTTSGAADRAVEDCPELNMGNYDEVDVERLNDWAIRAHDEINRLHALAAGQATAAQQVAAYATLPENYYLARGEVPTWDAKRMRAFADATHTLRASHGEAPAQPDQPIACSYGDNGYACCEGGPCQADVHNDKLAEQQAPATAQAEESVPAPPPECETEAEKRAFAFGWFKALESERMKVESVQEDAARLDWLDKQIKAQDLYTGFGWRAEGSYEENMGLVGKVQAKKEKMTARQAIDAARKQGGA